MSASPSSSELHEAEVEVTYGDVLTFMARQGVLRTITAPIDRVKFIMETQMEMIRRSTCSGAGGGVPPGYHQSGSSVSSSVTPSPSLTAAAGTNGGYHQYTTGPRGGSRGGGAAGSQPSFLLNSRSSAPTAGGVTAPFKTSFQAMRHICRHEGVGFGLWRGNGVQLTSMAAQTLCHYHLSEPVMRATYTVLAPETAEGHVITSYAGFFCSGFLCAFIPYPLDFLRFHLAVDVKGLPRTTSGSSIHSRHHGSQYPSQLSSQFSSHSHSSQNQEVPHRNGAQADGSTHRSGMRKSGERGPGGGGARFRTAPGAHTFSNNYRIPRGFAFLRHHPVLREWPQYCYTGLGLHLLGSGFYYISHFMMKNMAEFLWYFNSNNANSSSNMLPPPPPSILSQVIIDGIATLMATAIAHPIDLIRRRQMLAVLDDRTRYRNSWACVQQVAAEEGVRGFFRGMPISLGRMVILASLFQGIGIVEEMLMRRSRGA